MEVLGISVGYFSGKDVNASESCFGTFPNEAEMEAYLAALNQELEEVRQNLVLHNFKLVDAERRYEQIVVKYPKCFTPTISLYQVEMFLMNWFLCPSYQSSKDIYAMCEENIRLATSCIKESKKHTACEANFVYSLQLKVTRCELLIVQAFLDLNKKNVMSAAHTLVSVYNQYKKLGPLLRDCEAKVALKARLSLFCLQAVSSADVIDVENLDPTLIKSLAELIEKKTKEIRQMHQNRYDTVPETVLEATRDLLQLKQLYKDLSGKWKSSDGHKDCKVASEEVTESGREKKSDAGLQTPEKRRSDNIEDEDDEFDKENDYIRTSMKNSTPAKKGHLKAEKIVPLTVFSPRKDAVPTVKVLLPRFSDLSRLWDNTPALDHVIKPKAANQEEEKASIATEKVKKTQDHKVAEKPALPATSTINASVESFVQDDEVKLRETFQRAGDHHLLQLLAHLRARLLFANALFHLSLSLVPESMSWILAILNLKGDLIKGISTLYTLHDFQESMWSAMSTILLVNLPAEVVEQAFEQMYRSPAKYSMPGKTVSQFFAIINTQSFLFSWTSNHPMWVLSQARSHDDPHRSSEISANAHTKLDHYRRVLKLESGLIPNKMGSCVCYWVRYQMVRQFLSIGHYMQAITACRDLLNHVKDDESLSRAVTMQLVAASAALVMNEEFVMQTKYMQLKFDERIIINHQNSNHTVDRHQMMRKASFSALQSSSTFDRHQHLMAIVMQAFTQYYRSASVATSSEYHNRLFVGKEISEPGSSFQNRMVYYKQMHEMLGSMHAEDFDIYAVADLVMVEYLGSLTWLLPIEIVYLHQRNDHHIIQEASHSQLLQLADKGMLLFSEKYLVSSESEIYAQWSELISNIVVEDMVNKDSNVLKESLLTPRSRLALQYEQNLFTGKKQLRLRLVCATKKKSHIESSSIHDLAIQANQMIRRNLGVITLANSVYVDSSAASSSVEAIAHRRLRHRINKVKAQVEKLSSSWKVYEMPAKVEKLAGDMLVSWLFLRGRALQCLGRVWEAVYMYKLVLAMLRYSPRSKFFSFMAYYHLAEILVKYNILSCSDQGNSPTLAADYLDLACFRMDDCLNRENLSIFVADYFQSVQELSLELLSV